MARRSAHNYVEAVHERWTQSGARDRDSKRNEMRARFQHVHRQALRAKRPVVLQGTLVEYAKSPDYATAIKALEHESRLDGLYDTTESDQRALSIVVAVAKACLQTEHPQAFAKLLRALHEARGGMLLGP